MLLMAIGEIYKNQMVIRRGKNKNELTLLGVILRVGLLLVSLGTLLNEANAESVSVPKVMPAPDPDVLDGYGTSVAGNQNTVLVGAPNEIHNGHEAGRAYVVDRETGRVIHRLGLPRPTGGALFGQAVALNSRFALIGAPHGRDEEGTYTGGVYVYDLKSGKLLSTIRNPNPVTGAFGHALALQGARMVVGDPQASSDTIYYAGAAYVFDVTTGERLLTLHPSKPISGSPGWFGHSVDMSDVMIVVGAPHESNGSIPVGAVYGFSKKTGAVIHRFVNPHPSESLFGWSVALAEDMLIVGAFGHKGTFREEGVVYVFSVESGKLFRTVTNPDPQDGAHFGKAVGISSKFLIIGAPGDQVGETGMRRGAVYVFDRMTGKLLEKIVNPAKATGADDLFGAAVHVTNEQLIVGAPFGGEGKGLDAGLVYDFRIANVGLANSSEALSSTVP